jgi:hypothetical protein
MNCSPFSKQRGVFSIITAIGAVMLVLVLGFVVDGSRLMAVQSELKNASDACALAAAAELNGRSDAALRAKAAGVAIGSLNKNNFQSEAIVISPDNITFNNQGLNSNYVKVNVTSNANYRFVKCQVSYDNWLSYFMSFIGFDVMPSAISYAGLQKTRKICALPLALIKNGTAPTLGYTTSTTSAVLKSNIRFADYPDDGFLPSTTLEYQDLISKSGTCGVLTDLNSTVSVRGSANDSDLWSALSSRYTSDSAIIAGAASSNRQLFIVPIVEQIPLDPTKALIRDWACLEMTLVSGTHTLKYQGRATSTSSLPTLPNSPCVATGIVGITKAGGVSVDGPYAPVLVRQ